MINEISNGVFTASQQEIMKEAIERKKEFIDPNNHYLHLIVACGPDTISQASLMDLVEFNSTLKKSCDHFRTACIQYQCKSDTNVRD